MSGGSSAPDPYQTAAAQTQSNQQTAAYNAAINRVSEYTPYGNSVFSQSGTDSTGAPIYRNDITLAPEAQQQLDNQLKQNDQLSNLGFNLGSQANGALANGIDTSKLPALQTSPANTGNVQTSINYGNLPSIYGSDNFDAANQRTANAAYQQAASRLDPQWTNAQNQQDAKLANMGVQFGSGAYGKAQTQFDQAKNDAYNQAIYSAQAAGNAEQNNLFNQSLGARQQMAGEDQNQAQFANAAQAQQYAQALQAAQFGNQARAQGLQEQTALRDLPLNELNALRGSTQIQNPQFTTAPQSNAQGTDISGDIYKSSQMNAANQNNFLNGLFSLGSAALMASDRRLKRNIRRVGETPLMRLPLYAYEYVWDRTRTRVGVMADEALKRVPTAVHRMVNGYLAVDYGQVA